MYPPQSAGIQTPVAHTLTLSLLQISFVSVNSWAGPLPGAAVLGLGQRPRPKVESQVLLVGADRDM